MKSDVLLEAIGEIEDDMIVEAKAGKRLRRKRMGANGCRTGKFSARKFVAVAAVSVLCITIAMPPVLVAADVESAYQLMYALSPDVAQWLKPVRLSCVDNGIRMEVISADIYEEHAEIYISMQDLVGERVDGSIDLFDSYSINRPFSSVASCRQVSYDEGTGTATFLIHITQMDKKEIGGDKITFSVREFLSGKQEFEGEISEFDWSNVNPNPKLQQAVDIRGGGGTGDVETKDIQYLLPESEILYAPFDGISCTAIGYVDGLLHIQFYFENILETDNHGWVHLVDKAGNEYYGDAVSYWDEEHRGSYQEYIFDVPVEKLEDYQLHGYFVACSNLTKGDWQVTFPLEEKE